MGARHVVRDGSVSFSVSLGCFPTAASFVAHGSGAELFFFSGYSSYRDEQHLQYLHYVLRSDRAASLQYAPSPSFLIHRRNRGPQDHHLGADLRQDGDPQAAIRGGLRSERVHRCVGEPHGPPISDLRAGGARARVGSAVGRAAGAPVDPARDAQVPALRELGAAALPLCTVPR